jgi:hypothetical protein
MRVLSNLELCAVGGGDVEDEVQHVIVTGQIPTGWNSMSGAQQIAIAGLVLAAVGVIGAPVAIAIGADIAVGAAITVVTRVGAIGLGGLAAAYAADIAHAG